jgi:hypothetical protein
MSALGQKQTFAPQNVMSALPPKADIQRPVDESVPFIKSVAAPVGTAFGTERTESGTANMCEPT